MTEVVVQAELLNTVDTKFVSYRFNNFRCSLLPPSFRFVVITADVLHHRIYFPYLLLCLLRLLPILFRIPSLLLRFSSLFLFHLHIISRAKGVWTLLAYHISLGLKILPLMDKNRKILETYNPTHSFHVVDILLH